MSIFKPRHDINQDTSIVVTFIQGKRVVLYSSEPYDAVGGKWRIGGIGRHLPVSFWGQGVGISHQFDVLSIRDFSIMGQWKWS